MYVIDITIFAYINTQKTTKMNQPEVSQDKQVAGVILKQLGGNKFLAMTGATHLVCGKDEKGQYMMGCKLRRNKAGAQYMRISLTVMDTYEMQFVKFNSKTGEKKIVQDLSGIYNDTLQETYTRITGQNTHL